MSVIVVGVDGSPSSQKALRWAVGQAKLQGADIKVVTSWRMPEAVYLGTVIPESLVPELEDAARALQATAIAGIAAEGVKIQAEVAEGDPAQVLIDESNDALLLVVGSRGLGGFREIVLGSVSQRCAHHALCPVVIVRDGEDRH